MFPARGGTNSYCTLHPLQGLVEIGEHIIRGFTPGTEANETFGYGVAAPTSAALGGGVDAAETGGFSDQRAGGQKPLGSRTIRQNKADHGSEPTHLFGGKLVGRVLRQSWIAQARDAGAGREVFGNGQRVLLLPFQPEFQWRQRPGRHTNF